MGLWDVQCRVCPSFLRGGYSWRVGVLGCQKFSVELRVKALGLEGKPSEI